jgi:predicted phosphodiesterase
MSQTPPKVSNQIEKSIFLGDIHFPFQDNKALDIAKKFMKWYEPDIIFLIGDMLDFYTLSSFDKDPRRIGQLQDEIDMGVEFLTELREEHPSAEIVYIEGNHEQRLQRYLHRHPEISFLKAIQFTELLNFDELKIQFFEYKDPILYTDNFIVEHGHIAKKHAGATAKAMLMERNLNGISGHTHRMAQVSWSCPTGMRTWTENGCLCNLHPEYISGTPDWQHGFSIGEYYQEVDKMEVTPILVKDYRVVFRGRVFD